MAKVIIMPKLGFTQDEGELVAWHKNEGDTISKGESFFDVHTEKSVTTVEATEDGTVLKITVQAGETVPVFTPICVVGNAGEDADAALAAHVMDVAPDAAVEGDLHDGAQDDAQAAVHGADTEGLRLTPRAKRLIRQENLDPAALSGIKGTGFEGGITERDVLASPLARKAAAGAGIDLAEVTGTGAAGKIRKSDVEQAAAVSRSMPQGTDELIIAKQTPYKGVRKIIGDRLSTSKFTAPHLYFTDGVDTTNLTVFRKKLNEKSEIRYAVSDLLIMSASKALRAFPAINSALADGQITTYESTNIGLAVAGDNGLIVPVVKNVQRKTLSEVASETRDLIARAKEGRLSPEEYSGGTFSISNLGMFGIGNFTAIINPPEAAILSVSSVRKTPVVVTDEEGNDAVVIRPLMNIQLSVDHRIIDGLVASQFVEYFKALLEDPIRILL